MFRTNIHAIYPFTAAIFSLAIGTFVLLKYRKSFVNFSFFLLSLSSFIWQLGTFFILISTKPDLALFWVRFGFIGIALIPITTYQLVISLLLRVEQKRKFVVLGYLMSILLWVPLSWTKYFFSGVYIYPWGYWFRAGILHPLFLVTFGSYMIASFYRLFSAYNKEGLPLERMRKKYLLIALIVAYIGAIDYLPTYGVRVYPFGFLAVIICIMIIGYGIYKYRLMDINIALTRAGIFIIVYTLVLGIPLGLTGWGRYWLQGLFGPSWYWASVILAILLATLGPFLYIYLNRRAEERLLKEQRRYQSTLKQASVGMTRIRNLRKLLDLITHIVTKTVKLAYAGIYLYNQETNEFVLQVMRDKGRMPVPKLTPDNPLISWITIHRQPLVYEEVKRLSEDTNDVTYKLLEENMRLLTASVIIPNFLEDRFLGFFVLGEKTSGQIYTPDDLNVFEVLAAQAALAIENARFFEETKQMQEQIATAEKMATIGTMADGLSHQINNRFYALSLIAADTIDTIKMTDTSNCSPEVKEAFNQIAHALERVKANVIQGGQVVRGMLKYTRKGDEGFEALTLDQILDSTLDMVQYKVKLSEIDIIRNYPKDSPKIRGNSVQLQEAFFNFIDNGYDSTVERQELLKEAGYRGRLTFSAQVQENGTLLITAEDNGMGIKEEDKKKLFAPFFTTKVSSRQGTGLGLYVVKRVIEEFHKGKIWFESEYGKGTKFFIQLPIAKD